MPLTEHLPKPFLGFRKMSKTPKKKSEAHMGRRQNSTELSRRCVRWKMTWWW
jgi:hypothetical protein